MIIGKKGFFIKLQENKLKYYTNSKHIFILQKNLLSISQLIGAWMSNYCTGCSLSAKICVMSVSTSVTQRN